MTYLYRLFLIATITIVCLCAEKGTYDRGQGETLETLGKKGGGRCLEVKKILKNSVFVKFGFYIKRLDIFTVGYSSLVFLN